MFFGYPLFSTFCQICVLSAVIFQKVSSIVLKSRQALERIILRYTAFLSASISLCNVSSGVKLNPSMVSPVFVE